MRIAVAGNPNAGKTTLFNKLSGMRARVGNYPGVTVEHREATVTLPSGGAVSYVDLPGCYSLTARSPEEEIAHHVLMGALDGVRPDVTLCVVDATSLARGLYLVTQLLDLGLNLVVVLNMIDMVEERGGTIDAERLSEKLGVPVIPTAARNGRGIDAVVLQIERGVVRRPDGGSSLTLSADDETLIDDVQKRLRAIGHPDVRGEALWLLASDLDALRVRVPQPVVDAVHEARAEMSHSESENFNKRLIAARYRAIDELLVDVIDAPERYEDARSQHIDRLLLHPIGGMAIFISVMFLLFQAVFAWAEPMIGAVEGLMALLADAVGAVLPESLVRSLLVNGVIAGVGNILVFIPQIGLLFFGLSLLEESGYMARAAFLMDRMMRRVGLHGKSFIPLLSSFACAVPGVMAARTVESSRDRLVTILVAPFMSCSARLPVYILVITAVFSSEAYVAGFLSVGGLVITAMYFLGFLAAIFTAWLLKRSVLKSPPPVLIMEMPAYRAPLWGAVFRHVYSRIRIFVVQTGGIILALSILLWGLLTFPRVGLPEAEYRQEEQAAMALSAPEQATALRALEQRDQARRLENSIGGRIGHVIEPLIEPLGFDWRIGIGLVASFAAREVLVSTLGQVYALDAEVEADSPALRDAILADIDPTTGKPRFTPLVGLSLMVFFVLAMQCMSTVATVKRETNSWRWPLFQIAYMNALAYVVSLAVYQGGIAMGLQ